MKGILDQLSSMKFSHAIRNSEIHHNMGIGVELSSFYLILCFRALFAEDSCEGGYFEIMQYFSIFIKQAAFIVIIVIVL